MSSSTGKTSGGERVQSWMPHSLADELRAAALVERRSVSQLVRLAVESSFAQQGGGGEATARGGGFLSSAPARDGSPEQR